MAVCKLYKTTIYAPYLNMILSLIEAKCMKKSFYKSAENISPLQILINSYTEFLSPIVICKLISLYVKLKRSSCGLIRFCLVVINITFVSFGFKKHTILFTPFL